MFPLPNFLPLTQMSLEPSLSNTEIKLKRLFHLKTNSRLIMLPLIKKQWTLLMLRFRLPKRETMNKESRATTTCIDSLKLTQKRKPQLPKRLPRKLLKLLLMPKRKLLLSTQLLTPNQWKLLTLKLKPLSRVLEKPKTKVLKTTGTQQPWLIHLSTATPPRPLERTPRQWSLLKPNMQRSMLLLTPSQCQLQIPKLKPISIVLEKTRRLV